MATYEQMQSVIDLLQVTNTCLTIIIFAICVYALICGYHYILKNLVL